MKLLIPPFIILFLAGILGCVPQPKRDYSPGEVAQISSLKELMRVLAHDMDPLFSKRDQASYTEAEFAVMVKSAARTDAVSTTLKDRFAAKQGGSFGDLALQLNAGAKQLQEAGTARQRAPASVALRGMLQACKACHKKYK